MDMSDNDITNRSGNRPFADVLDANLSRRRMMQGGLITAAAFIAGGPAAAAASEPSAAAARSTGNALQGGSLLGFTNLDASTADAVRVPPGYTAEAILKWGDPIMSNGPTWSDDASNSAVEQAAQIGTGHDGIHFFPLPPEDGLETGVLCLNHEYAIDEQMFTDGTDAWRHWKTKKSQFSMGVSVLKVQQAGDGTWSHVDSNMNRRITARSRTIMKGQAARHRLTRTAADPSGKRVRGTFNNCGNGYTPWGTYLTTEENFNGYFHVTDEASLTSEQAEINERYGVGGEGFGIPWATTDARFDASGDNQQEPNRHGWIVEIDPMRPNWRPRKRTALGRFKHEGAAFTESSGGRAVVYMGDDQRFDYVYKFVSNRRWRVQRDLGRSPLDHGVLFVARFDEDGSGDWLPLRHGTGPLTAANGFADQGDVLVKTRLAADLLGATPMDRPEWIAVHPDTGEVYCNMTNNSRRETPNAANLRAPNPDGHNIRITEDGGDAAATTFMWDLAFVGGAGVSAGDGSTMPDDAAFGSPDGLAFDDRGVLWIQTDGGQPIECNNQMVAYDPASGDFRRFLTGPAGCEVTGITWSGDKKTMFINIQHPGDDGTRDDPTSQSSWPDGVRPRAATVAITKDDGGDIGT